MNRPYEDGTRHDAGARPGNRRRPIAIALAIGAVLALWLHHRKPSPVPDDFRPATLTVRRSIRVEPAAGTARYRIRMLRIPTTAGQRILSESWSQDSNDSGLDPAGAWIGWDVPSPAEPREFVLETVVEVLNTGLSGPVREGRSDDPSGFLASDTFRPLDDPEVRSLAASIPDGDTLAVLRGIWDLVTTQVSYGGYDPLDRGAAVVARTKSGDCSEFTDLMVALARLHGLPARRMNGWTRAGAPLQKHAWAEIWIASRGWTAFDPTWGRSRTTGFESVPTPRVAVAWNPSGADLEHQPYSSWRWWGQTAPIFSSRDTVF